MSSKEGFSTHSDEEVLSYLSLLSINEERKTEKGVREYIKKRFSSYPKILEFFYSQ